MKRHVIFLSGPIGCGKTTLGRALADKLDADFVDGDDLSEGGTPWLASILRTCRAIVARVSAGDGYDGAFVVAYPLRCTNWIYFRRRLGDQGISTTFVTLRASYTAITDARRGRDFTPAERARIRIMLDEGYSDRAFSDIIVDSASMGIDETLDVLLTQIQLMGEPCLLPSRSA
jgi:hypothetical protein